MQMPKKYWFLRCLYRWLLNKYRTGTRDRMILKKSKEIFAVIIWSTENSPHFRLILSNFSDSTRNIVRIILYSFFSPIGSSYHTGIKKSRFKSASAKGAPLLPPPHQYPPNWRPRQSSDSYPRTGYSQSHPLPSKHLPPSRALRSPPY